MNEKRPVLQMRINDEFEKSLQDGMQISGINNKSDFIRMCVNYYLLSVKHEKKPTSD